MRTGDGRATNAVFRNLQKYDNFRSAWQLCLGKNTSFEDFVANAKRWLKEESQLKTRTIDMANWREIYDYFRTFLTED